MTVDPLIPQEIVDDITDAAGLPRGTDMEEVNRVLLDRARRALLECIEARVPEDGA